MNALIRLTPLALALLSAPLLADVHATRAWVRGTIVGQSATGAFVTLKSSEDCVLIEAHTPVAARVEIHAMNREDNVMKMRPLTGLELPAGKTVELRPGGNHIMLMDLIKPLGKGDIVPITLVVKDINQKQLTIEIKAEVLPLGSDK